MLAIIAFLLILLAVTWQAARRVPRLRNQLESRLARALAHLGPMTPRRLVSLTVRSARRNATPTYSGAFLPSHIAVFVHSTDASPWGTSVLKRQPGDIKAALREKAADGGYLQAREGPEVTLSVDDTLARPHRPYFVMHNRPSAVDSTPRLPPVRTVTASHSSTTEPLSARTPVRPATPARPKTVGLPTRLDTPSHSRRADGHHRPNTVGLPTERICNVRVLVDGMVGSELWLSEGTYVIGRGIGCDIAVDEPSVSAHHAELVVRRDRVSIRDLGSSNGTRVRWGFIDTETRLSDSDVVRLSASVSLEVSNTGSEQVA